MSIILSHDDLFRMKQSILPVIIDHSKVNRKAELKRLSDEKVKNWPNTLEAMRLKKEMFLKERADQDELRRQDMDRQEAEIRNKERTRIMDKANKLQFAMTDNMKYLKSQIMYADSLHERVSQIEWKKKVSDDEKVVDAQYHKLTLEKVRAGDREDEIKAEKKKEVMKQVATMREIQCAEVRARREAEVEVARKHGEEMKADAVRRLEEAAQQMKDREAHIAKCNVENLLENEKLRIIRDNTRQAELDAIAAKDAEKDIIENRKKAIKALQIRLFEKQQETKQKLIDVATEQLSKKLNNDNATLNNQIAELRAKEDLKEANKAKARQDMKDAIEQSRKEQMEKKEIEWQRNKVEDDKMLIKWRKENEDAIQAEKDKVTAAEEKVKKLKAIQYAEASVKHKKRVEDKIALIEEERLMQSLSGEDSEKFKDYAFNVIDEYKAAGKPTYTLYKALETHVQPLLAAKTNKDKRKKKDE